MAYDTRWLWQVCAGEEPAEYLAGSRARNHAYIFLEFARLLSWCVLYFQVDIVVIGKGGNSCTIVLTQSSSRGRRVARFIRLAVCVLK